MNLPYGLLADGVLLVHLAFVVFAVCGGFWALRQRWVVWLHLPALAWGVWVEWSGSICPLTPLENELLRRAGLSGYGGDFIGHYLVPLLYPADLSRAVQWFLGGMLLAVNILAYGWLWRRLKRRKSGV
jgi:hypothetical protein